MVGWRCLAEQLEAGVGAMFEIVRRLEVEKAVEIAVAAVAVTVLLVLVAVAVVNVVLVLKRSLVLQAGGVLVGSGNPALSRAPGR